MSFGSEEWLMNKLWKVILILIKKMLKEKLIKSTLMSVLLFLKIIKGYLEEQNEEIYENRVVNLSKPNK